MNAPQPKWDDNLMNVLCYPNATPNYMGCVISASLFNSGLLIPLYEIFELCCICKTQELFKGNK